MYMKYSYAVKYYAYISIHKGGPAIRVGELSGLTVRCVDRAM